MKNRIGKAHHFCKLENTKLRLESRRDRRERDYLAVKREWDLKGFYSRVEKEIE